MNKNVNKGGGSKVALFFKKNVYYILLGLSLLAVGIIITLALVLGNNAPVVEPPIDGEVPVDVPPVEVTMLVPIAGDFTIGENFDADDVVWFSTLERYKAHLGLDFVTGADVDVLAALDGVVESVEQNELFGVVVTIDHGNNLKTVYMSLGDNVTLKAGDTVTRGAVIGQTSDTMGISMEMGKHLHFEVYADGKQVNPHDYITVAADK